MRWFSMSTRMLSDPRVEELGEKHGPAGPLVWVALLCQAGAQDGAGTFEITLRTLSHEAFTTTNETEKILDTIADLGLCHTLSHDGHTLSATVKSWKKWQNAGRKAKSRRGQKEADEMTRNPSSQADVTPGHDHVTPSHNNSTVQDNKKERASPFSPSPKEKGNEQRGSLSQRVCSQLQGGVDSLTDAYPAPNESRIAKALNGTNPEIAMRVAREVREIVQAQDRAPNITSLYLQLLATRGYK